MVSAFDSQPKPDARQQANTSESNEDQQQGDWDEVENVNFRTRIFVEMSRGGAHYDGKIAGLYDLGDTLGRGHFAVVKLARHVFTGEQVAVKVIDKTRLDEVSRSHLFQEVRCMKLVQHPNVVRLYDVIDTQTKLYLILELGDGGDMYDYILRHEDGVEEETAKKYFRQIVHAISYCHKLHVVHRDLKPENVVFFEKLGMVKLTDFGFSNKFCPGQKLETSCGSLAYSAPEILLGDSYDAPKVDVWSLGVILYMLVCGRAPFQEANDSETLTMIMDCKYIVPTHLSHECVRLIGDMLIRDPDKRATLEQIAADPWLNAGDAVQPADHLPLVSREHLSEEDHSHIVQKMVNGNIAAKEEIVEALDKNEYNHITATYYLLAERKLRAQRQERAQMINSQRISRTDLSPVAITPSVSSAVPSPAQEKPPSTVDGLLSPCLLPRDFSPFDLPSVPFQRKCSIVREEEDSNASGASSPARSPSACDAPLAQHLEKLEEGNSPPEEEQRLTFPVPSVAAAPSPAKRRLHAVLSSPQLPLGGGEAEGPARLRGGRKYTAGKPAIRGPGTTISQVMLRRIEQQKNKLIEESSTEDVPGPWKGASVEAKKASFAHSVFSTESTDSLDFLSDNQPRLTSSMSCGDLSTAENTATPTIVRSDSISLTEIPPDIGASAEEKRQKDGASFNRYCTSASIGNSLSLNSGLSSLQRHKLNLKKNKSAEHHSSQPDKISVPRRSGLGRLVGPRAASRLDINQNGWRKNNSKRDLSSSGDSKGVADMKLASKCCTLC
ncbi:hypothetical protein JTE90_025170 [Oedothorax gibbosus]|uniref:SNF-related serine/threonine-protein kinase n=1 Tax=Oedothorax gibbosus TaxID=931172 RepID=A0AAV6UHB9_9ARAC|nr:hypothetical protein JTE90_025170 [Oedothorax gibbosus]